MKKIDTPERLVCVLNDLKHYLKSRKFYKYPMLEDFNDMLNQFIMKWRLDGDQHVYATMPEKGKLPGGWVEVRPGLLVGPPLTIEELNDLGFDSVEHWQECCEKFKNEERERVLDKVRKVYHGPSDKRND